VQTITQYRAHERHRARREMLPASNEQVEEKHGETSQKVTFTVLRHEPEN